MFHLFLFDIEPSLESDQYGSVSRGRATVLVSTEESQQDAKRLAENHVKAANWDIKKLVFASSHEEESRTTNPELLQLIRTAKAFGVGCIYDLGRGGAPRFN